MGKPDMGKGSLAEKIVTVCWIIGAVLYFGAQMYMQGKKEKPDQGAQEDDMKAAA